MHFSNGGSGIRYRDERLDAGDEPPDGAQRYLVEWVEKPHNPSALGNAVSCLFTPEVAGSSPVAPVSRLAAQLDQREQRLADQEGTDAEEEERADRAPVPHEPAAQPCTDRP